MAIAFDAAGNSSGLGASPKTWNHTCTGSDLILFVVTMCGTDTVTGVTYNGVALTLAGKNTTVGAAGGYYPSIWYLIGPATGTNTVSVTTSSGNVTGVSASYTGVGGIDNTAVQSGTGGETSPHTDSITTIADNCWVAQAVSAVSASNGAAGTGFTTRGNGFPTNGAGSSGFGDSNSAKTPAGSVSMSTVWSDFPFAGRFAGTVMVSFYPAGAGGGSTTRNLASSGVGK